VSRDPRSGWACAFDIGGAGYICSLERTSDEHSARKDESLKEEVDAVISKGATGTPVRESRERGRLETEPHQDEVVAVARRDVPPSSLPPEEVERRQDIGRFLERKFPASREEILHGATEMRAPPEVIRELAQLPDGVYDGVPEIWQTLGGEIEGGRKH
jgi:hypothetical protein